MPNMPNILGGKKGRGEGGVRPTEPKLAPREGHISHDTATTILRDYRSQWVVSMGTHSLRMITRGGAGV